MYGLELSVPRGSRELDGWYGGGTSEGNGGGVEGESCVAMLRNLL